MRLITTFVVTPELEAELLDSLEEAERGEVVPADELLQRLRWNRGRRAG